MRLEVPFPDADAGRIGGEIEAFEQRAFVARLFALVRCADRDHPHDGDRERRLERGNRQLQRREDRGERCSRRGGVHAGDARQGRAECDDADIQQRPASAARELGAQNRSARGRPDDKLEDAGVHPGRVSRSRRVSAIRRSE